MRAKILGLALIASLLFTWVAPQIALAHEKVTAGPYTIEAGWVGEPPIVDLKNAVAINISTTSDDKPVEGVSTLNVTVITGGNEKQLDMHPLGEDTPGQYAADFIPTRRGTFTVNLTGKIENTDVNVSVDIEEVADASSLQFPEAQPSIGDLQNTINDLGNQVNSARTLGIVGSVVAVISLVLAAVALRKQR